MGILFLSPGTLKVCVEDDAMLCPAPALGARRLMPGCVAKIRGNQHRTVTHARDRKPPRRAGISSGEAGFEDFALGK